jgi:hypothetical protein
MFAMMKRYIIICWININNSKRSWNCFEHCTIKESRFCYDCEYWSTNILNSNWILFLTNSVYSRMIMKFWCFFMWTTSFSHLQQFLSYQSLMSYIDDVNQERVYIYRQKVKLVCYFVIITRSNIIKIVFKLTRHFINFNSKHLKTANYCIKYLHVIKFLIIRYSNSKNEKFSNQISSSNKKKSNKKMSSTSNSKLNRKTSSNKENNDKQIFKRTINAFFANDLDRKSVEEYIFKLFDDMIDWAVKKKFIVSIFIIEAKLFSMLHVDNKFIWWIHLFQKLKFNSNQKIMIYNDNLQIIRFLSRKFSKLRRNFDTSTSHNDNWNSQYKAIIFQWIIYLSQKW